jgi:hypothetical protein
MYAAKSLGSPQNGDVIALAYPIRHGFSEGHTSEEVALILAPMAVQGTAPHEKLLT